MIAKYVSVSLALLATLTASAQTNAQKNATVIRAARAQVGVTHGYDNRYHQIAYPGGDVPVTTGVCADVIVRAFRAAGLDLQVMVHDDMRKHFSAYPRKWRLTAPDANIDHRRVPNLEVFLRRSGKAVSVTKNGPDYLPGDIVVWRLLGGLPHIGLVSDRRATPQRYLVIHNVGAGTREEDVLFAYEITGHFRWFSK
ncbi:MAG TPA: DUF1287 domain-containing protein [Thermoanaerobaculia bacterium]|nr:DUF1287 domain-containing protein [Thermoanaerobaculia bacterium]